MTIQASIVCSNGGGGQGGQEQAMRSAGAGENINESVLHRILDLKLSHKRLLAFCARKEPRAVDLKAWPLLV